MKSEVKQYLSELGKRGGQVKSEAKTKACRLNATKPRKKRRGKTPATSV